MKLDEHGHAEATVPLNDSLTSFRIVAVADGAMDLFGTGSASVQSTQDLMLFLACHLWCASRTSSMQALQCATRATAPLMQW